MNADSADEAAVIAIAAALRGEMAILPPATARKLAARLWSVGQVAMRRDIDDWMRRREQDEQDEWVAEAAADADARLQRERAERERERLRREAARPPPRRGSRDHALLGLSPIAPADDIQRAWRERAKRCHPDAGGSTEMMAQLNAARDALLRAARA